MTTAVADGTAEAVASRPLPRRPVVPWSVWVAGSALSTLVALTAILLVANGVGWKAAVSTYAITDLVAAIAFGAVGLLVMAYRPRERLALLFVLIAVGCAVAVVSAQYARYGLATHPGSLPGASVAAWLANWVWGVGYAAFLVGVPLLFPNGRLASSRWRPVAALAVVATAMLLVGASFASGGVNQDLPGIPNPYALTGAAGTAFTDLAHAGTLLLLLALVAALVSVRSRWRAAIGRERAQLRLMLLAGLALVVGEALTTVTMLAVTGTVNPTVQSVADTALVLLLASAVGVAVLRHRLYDIDVWLNRALVYGVLSVAVIGSYIAVVAYFVVALDVRGHGPALVATGVVAVAFQPVRDRVQCAVNRLLYGRRDEPYGVLTSLSRRLNAAPVGDSLAVIADTIRVALHVPYAEVKLRGDDHAVAAGEPAPVVAAVPLMFGRDIVGELRLAGRQPGELLTAADLRVLADFAAQAGVAASASRLAVQLDGARQRLVTTREEERRRLARDLHDGLGPQLASYTLTLDAARALLDSAPARADSLLVELREQVQQAVSDVRRIARDLRPVALEGRGLAEAMADHLGRLHTGLVTLDVDMADMLPGMSAATEVAAFRILTEAVTNTLRHADATGCSVRVAAADDVLAITVRDNGRGMGLMPSPGMGLTSMRERAAELGGRCVISSDHTGTTVDAQLPLHLRPA